MTVFAGSGSELASLIQYERDALEFVRSVLFNQSEAAARLEIDLSAARNEDGSLRGDVRLLMVGVASGDEAVRSALSRLRPLAFSAAFKLQDMIVEWVLRANGSTAWRFQAKIQEYERMKRTARLCEPPGFVNRGALSDTFWALYSALARFRNKIIHKGSFSVLGTTLTIADGPDILQLTDAEQGAYIRALCLLADGLMSSAIPDASVFIIENDLHQLSSIHNVTGLNQRPVRLASITATGTGRAVEDGRLEATIDFDEIRRCAEKSFPIVGGIVLFDLRLIIRVGIRQATWAFPVGAAPTGVVQIVEGNSRFEPYRAAEALQ
ncbi:hypothetical protein V5279_22530 [Bradyrhizobium sp. 26S5]|uniref:hypothetical protein n=1 Tax=Bradyrhizobium sp. 26S5 TaxID=3139729 RepID=UPI0030CB9AE8